jgi:1,4-alpha-glucan branching enzyme
MEETMVASIRTGMGAVPYSGGVTFRVWALFASAVSVAGGFNDWNINAAPMTAEGDGYWSLDVDGAVIGDQYKFVITSPSEAGALWKNDPYALATALSPERNSCGRARTTPRRHGTKW